MEPCGVIAAVLPWNFPLFLACAKLGPALAVGNSVILKPAEQSPLTTIRLAELALEAGIPPGVVNVVTGFGETAGQAIGLHPDIDVVGFVGSSEVGKLFLTYSAQSNMKRVFLECGGKSPNIIFADTPDLAAAAQASIHGVFNNQGEICCAPTRLLVEASIQAPLLDALREYSQPYQPRNPLDPQAEMGAMVDEIQNQTSDGLYCLRPTRKCDLGVWRPANSTRQ